ncbi:MAG: hypothetical protein KDB03_09995 [Planctomycetales bacterium]|nr:hypothetical protein [Planctomycetales bacterium]
MSDSDPKQTQCQPMRNVGQHLYQYTTLIVLAVSIWSYLLYQLWLAAPIWTPRIIISMALLGILACIATRCWNNPQARLRTIVVTLPMATAFVTLPVQSLNYRKSLLSRLETAGIQDFTLEAKHGYSRFLRYVGGLAFGEASNEHFATQLTKVTLDLNRLHSDGLDRLPRNDLRMIYIQRIQTPSHNEISPSDPPWLSASLVNWINSCSSRPLVSIHVVAPQPLELQALSELQCETILKLENLSLNSPWDFYVPKAFDIKFVNCDLSSGNGPDSANLPYANRIELDHCKFDGDSSILHGQFGDTELAFNNCRLDVATANQLLAGNFRSLSLSNVHFDRQPTIDASTLAPLRSLVLWETNLEPTTILELVSKRNPRFVQLSENEIIGEQQFSELIAQDSLRILNLSAPWLTAQHLQQLKNRQTDLRLTLMESGLSISTLDSIQRQLPSGVVIRIMGNN